jgi:hypothetical protein
MIHLDRLATYLGPTRDKQSWKGITLARPPHPHPILPLAWTPQPWITFPLSDAPTFLEYKPTTTCVLACSCSFDITLQNSCVRLFWKEIHVWMQKWNSCEFYERRCYGAGRQCVVLTVRYFTVAVSVNRVLLKRQKVVEVRSGEVRGLGVTCTEFLPLSQCWNNKC